MEKISVLVDEIISIAENRKRNENNIIYSMKRTLTKIEKQLRDLINLKIKQKIVDLAKL